MAKDRILSTGRNAQEEADYQATGRKPMWQRAGMTREEYVRGKAQNAAEHERESVRDHAARSTSPRQGRVDGRDD